MLMWGGAVYKRKINIINKISHTQMSTVLNKFRRIIVVMEHFINMIVGLLLH